MLILHGRIFSIVRGEICGVVTPAATGEGPAVSWSLLLEAGARSFNDVLWPPRLFHGELAFPHDDWRAIAGTAFHWPTAHLNGVMSVFEPIDMESSSLAFGERDGYTFDVVWRGRCSFGIGDAFEHGAFNATTRATLSKIYVHGRRGDDAKSLRALFARRFDPDAFDQGAIEWVDPQPWLGSGLARCPFAPRLV